MTLCRRCAMCAMTLRTLRHPVHLVLLLLLTGAGAAAESDTGDTPTATIAGSVWVGDAPTRIADALDYFDDSLGPDSPEHIRIAQRNTGRQALDMLLHDQAEFALSTPTPVALAILRQRLERAAPGQQLVILASISLTNLSHQVIAHRERGIREPADLAGRRIGMVFDTASHHSWDQFVRFHNAANRHTELVNIPVKRLAKALRAGEIDAAVAWSPWTDEIRAELGEAAIVFPTREFHTVNWLLVTRRDTAMNRHVLTRRILDGYYRAVRLLLTQPARAAQIDARATKAGGNQVALTQGDIVWHLELGWGVLANLDTQFRWLGQRDEYAGVERPLPADYLYAGPLGDIAPYRVKLPAYLHTAPVTGRVTP